MKIFIWKNGEETGPFERVEVFARLNRGEFSQDDPSRTDDASDWQPLVELLKHNAAGALFSLDRIVEQSESIEEVEATREVALPSRSRSTDAAPIESRQTWTRFAPLAAAAVVAFAAAYMWQAARQKYIPSVSAQPAADPHSGRMASLAAPAGASATSKNPPKQVQPDPVEATAPEPLPAPDPGEDLIAMGSQAVPVIEESASMPLNPEPAPEAAEMMVATAETEIPSPPPEADAPIVVRSLDFGGIHEVDEVRFWVAETSPEPRAILVLCLDPNDNPEAIARDGVWQEFARANRLTLLALSFKSDEKVLQAGRGYYRAELGAGASLLAATEQLSATALPLIVYGRGGGGAFGTSFAAWKPDRVLAWASYTAQWRVQPARATAMPPGLLVSDREEVKKSDAAEAFFTRGRAIQSPWTWLCLGGVWQERQAKLDDFVREYLAKCLSSDPSQSDSAWVGLETLKVIGPAERMAAPAKAAWLPAASLVPSWAALMRDKGHGKTARIVQKTVPTRNPRQPNLDLYLRLPPSAQEGKEVSGVLAFCTWEANQAAILSKLDMRSDDKPIDLEGPTGMVRAIIEFTEKHNLAILTWGTVDAWNNDLNTAELARKQQKESDRTFDLLATAWERGVKELGRETGIPQKNYLLYGVSRGAQWAHRLALRKPDYFLAVHVHIPSTFDKPTPEANKPLWLLTTGELEYGYERAQQFYAGCRAFGYPIIFKAIVGIGHSGSHIADALSVRFFEYALSVQDLREGYEKRRKDPFARNKEDPSAPWLESFRSPEFFGDLMNQECFPVAKLDQIPEPFRVPLPTKILAEAWNQ